MTVFIFSAAPAHAQCADPAGSEGDVIFNDAYNVPQYCDGNDNWIAMVGSNPNVTGGGAVIGPTSGLVGYWRMDESSGTNVADDSGQGRDGTHTNATPDWAPSGGRVDGALEFTPSTDTIDVGNWEVGGTGGITIAAWVYKRSDANSGRRIISKADTAVPGDHAWGLKFGSAVSEHLEFRLTTVNGNFNETSFDGSYPAAYLNEWHHVAVTYDESDDGVEYYIDGVLVDTDTHNDGGAIDTTSGDPIGIGNQPTGAGNDNTGRSMDGFLDEVRVYNRPLSAAEISQLYGATVSKFTQIVPYGLVGHWRLDETVGTTAADSSGNGNDGTLEGGMDFASDTTVGRINNAAMFGGDITNYEINVADDNSLDLIDYTFTAWVRVDEFDTQGAYRVVGKQESSTGLYVMDINLPENALRCRYRNNATSQSADDTIEIGRWYFVACVHDDGADELTAYIDAVAAGPSVVTAGTADTEDAPLTIGYQFVDNLSSASDYFNGSIDDVRIYNRALTADELAEIYAARDGIRYNETFRVPEFFDGNKWVAMPSEWPQPGGAFAPASSSYADEINGLNPIVHYRKNDTGSPMVDEAGTYNGSYHNSPTFLSSPSPADPGGSSVYYNGANSEYARTLDDPIFDTTEGTVIAWFNIDDASGGLEAIFCKDGGGDVDGQFYVGVNNGDIDGRVQQDGGSTTFTYDPSATALGADVQSGTWYMLSMAYGTGGVDFYLNGVFLGTETRLTRTDSDRNFLIGAENSLGSTDNFFTGLIDEVSWLPTKLDATAIANLYNAGSNASGSAGSGDPSLVFHYKLDETEGTTINDSSGKGNHGTAENGLDASVDSMRGAVGRALYFGNLDPTAPNNSAHSEIDTPDLLDDTNDVTASLWIYPMPLNSQYSRIFTTSGIRVLEIWVANQLRYRLPGVSATLVSASTIPDYQWTHITVTYNAATKEQKIFLNGVEDASQIDAGISFTNFITQIGEGNDGYEGGLDDIRLYSRLLSDYEIMQLYQMGTPVGSSTALPQGCPNIGDVCDDGTVYVGLSSDGDVELYATPDELGALPWNNGATNYVTTSVNDLVTGEDNTNALVTIDSDNVASDFQTHEAAQACYDLVAHGADDWYLPAHDFSANGELGLAINNNPPLLATLTSDTFFWISVENNDSQASGLYANSSGVINSGDIGKEASGFAHVLCVRKGPAPRCANPYGREGDMFYNTDHDVVQYCDGARWIGIGKDE